MGHDQIDLIEAYFAALNPIARKIHNDISSTKSTYDHLWNELKTHEQCDLINEALIKPEITLRYFNSFSTSISAASTTSSAILNEENDGHDDLQRLLDSEKVKGTANNVFSFDGKNLKLFNHQKTGQKLIHDDVIGLFRDEHSAPFSFKTKSQLNLNLFNSPSDDESMGATAAFKSLMNHQKKVSPKVGVEVNPAGPRLSPVTVKSSHNEYEEMSAANSNLILSAKNFKKFTLEDSDDCKSVGFFRNFICKDNLVFNAIVENNSRENIEQGGKDGKNTTNRDSYESKASMAGDPNIAQEDSSNSLLSEEDDDKHVYEESRLLLDTSGYDLRKGFEFLSNW
ncbi:unnamed protein product [Hermetia illucens]|uniref:DUF4706 domain-containing protein n=1 Tax=Hermetia illucens TaxID=343691 RepID=A0A7R8Z5F4_HERIL|nr:uncharacterized protein LOC119660935 [Hermetia illucens]XP_037925855.1 uncharacterized protein LOC119660935 [Hermetia illucens]XP_037925856.1 uncharacterized protein LOC119660935 [Hermetia illucens]XP_037925857.1 uncharacterized protein LOC119660935 [Hermetia illucens]CAD7094052.1 unnamed protein product [Hermetia illucens]